MEKRKTTTSTAVKQRYNNKTYDVLRISVKKETAAAYKAKCEAEGITYSEPLHAAIEAFLK